MKWNKLPLYPFLFALYPILFLLSNNIEQISIGVTVRPIIISLISTFVIWLILGLILRNYQKSALITGIFVFLFFIYGHITQAMGEFHFFLLGRYIGKNKTMIPLMSLLFLVSSFFVIKTKRVLFNVTGILNTVTVCLVGLHLLFIGYELLTLEKIEIKEETGLVATRMPEKLPNIYYIIVDGYGREDILNEVYNYDNTPFIEFLESKGFYVAAKSRANYFYTELSLASTLNLDYLDELAKIYGIETLGPQQVTSLLENSRISRFLKSVGYNYIAFSTCISNVKFTQADYLMSHYLTLSEFENILLNTTPLPQLFKGFISQYNFHREQILYTLDNLVQVGKKYDPAFIFAHVMIPHPPFVFDENGNATGQDVTFTIDDGDVLKKYGITQEEYINKYKKQIIFTNKYMTKTVNNILDSAETPPVIILQSDHGPRSQFYWEDRERSNLKEAISNLNALYIPDYDRGKLYPQLSPVNNFRVVLNEYFGVNYPLLEDRSFFSYKDSRFDLSEIPDTLQ
jgi:hypothetical protein